MMATAVSGVSEARRGTGELLPGLRKSLHEMSQPMTVLLCALEYAGSLESSPEMKEMIAAGAVACARLSATVRAMQAEVKRVVEREGGGMQGV